MKENTFRKLPTTSIILDTRRAYLETGCYPTKIIIYFQQKRRYYSTGIPLTEEEYESIVSILKLKTKELKEIRKRLNNILLRADKIIEQLGNDFNFENFDLLFKGKAIKAKNIQEENNVFTLFKSYITRLEGNGQIGTASCYQNALNSLMCFSPTLTFQNISIEFLYDYEKWMLTRGGAASTIGMYLRNLRRIINIQRQKSPEIPYPFGRGKYEIPTSRNIKKALTEQAIAQIINLIPISRGEAWARDIWLFSFYCNGMNMSDIFSLKMGNIQDDFIYFTRQKTVRTKREQEAIEIFISPPIAAIIEKWRTKDGEYIFTIYTPNMSLKERFNTLHKVIFKINYHMKK